MIPGSFLKAGLQILRVSLLLNPFLLQELDEFKLRCKPHKTHNDLKRENLNFHFHNNIIMIDWLI